ncbi:DUF6134 family protein [Zobellia uliginosa]|uniref:DUF6134 family protein n=1 Tax=Zobellia uliginosa TaxID=143224 RepID=UPI001C071059|nr:DUF6134 family protein [Zobellia uliginosa]MBU2945287.1 hypothetical protein [Zobellia uliginosa]
MIKQLVWLILFIGLTGDSISSVTTLHYDIVMKDKVIGSLDTHKRTKGDLTTYESFTSIKTKLLTKIEVDYKYDVAFNKSLLRKAKVSIVVNNKQHAETSTLWKDQQYQIIKNNKESSIQDPIQYTTILMYFKEPKQIKHCYSEQDGTMNTIIPLGNNSYKKINANGKENIYFYKNGTLQKASIDGGLVDFELILRE